MDLLSRAFRNGRASLRAAGEFGSSAIPPNSGILGSVGGSSLTEQGALAISTVYLCCKVLYEDQGILPFRAYRGSRTGARSPIGQQPGIVSSPFGPDTPRSVGFGQLRLSLAMRGNAFVQIVSRDRMGYPTQVRVAHPDNVRVRRSAGVKQFAVGSGPWVDGNEVKHLMGPSMPGSDVGMDPVTNMRVALALADDVAQYGANFFRNGASPSGVISVKGAGDKAKARELKETWEAGHSGVVNAHRPAVLFGDAQWSPMSVTPENAQFLATRAYSREEICGWFGVPLQRIQAIIDNASQGGGAGLESIEQGYLVHTWLPWTTSVEEIWDGFIAGDASTWTMFDFSELLRVSARDRASIAQTHRIIGARNVNEIRADEGWASIGPEGDEYGMPLNSSKGAPAGGPVPDAADPAADPTSQGGQQ